MPEKTLISFGEHGKLSGTLPRNGGDCEDILANFKKAGINVDKLGGDLQSQGAKSFDDSWQNLLSAIEAKGESLQGVA